MPDHDFKKNLRQLLLFLMLIAFLLSLTTGLIKFPQLQKYFIFIYNYISSSTISRIHDFSGLALIILIIIHLITKRKRLFPHGFAIMAKLGQMKKIKKPVVVTVVIILALLAGLIFFFNKNQPVKLSGVEITSYRGEKLGSINDFVENSIKGVQYINKDSYSLKITGLVSKPASYSYSDVLKLPSYQKVVTINCVEGWSVKILWQGILVKDLFRNLTIEPQAKTVIFYAADGYSTSFPLSYILNNNIIMAYKMNGVTLPPQRGFPFQLVAEQKWGYKWIKWITKIELSSDTNYKGFWESRGYNNNGDVNGSKFAQ